MAAHSATHTFTGGYVITGNYVITCGYACDMASKKFPASVQTSLHLTFNINICMSNYNLIHTVYNELSINDVFLLLIQYNFTMFACIRIMC